jgi:hypothetical protein
MTGAGVLALVALVIGAVMGSALCVGAVRFAVRCAAARVRSAHEEVERLRRERQATINLCVAMRATLYEYRAALVERSIAETRSAGAILRVDALLAGRCVEDGDTPTPA